MECLEAQAVQAIHDVQIATHGGLAGLRDAGLLESALARPRHRHAFGEEDFFALAASLTFGIARNHPFLDANKRTAWSCGRTFLLLNGIRLVPDRAQAVEIMVRLAEGALDEAGFADWLRSQPVRT